MNKIALFLIIVFLSFNSQSEERKSITYHIIDYCNSEKEIMDELKKDLGFFKKDSAYDISEYACISYFDSIIASLKVTNYLVEEAYGHKYVCEPEPLSPKELINLANNYLKNNPDTKKDGAYLITMYALLEKYPCKK